VFFGLSLRRLLAQGVTPDADSTFDALSDRLIEG
jgi:hypothetical protein